ncbi:MAG: ATP-binding protein [Solirubrobacteraceae bacterium]
MGPFVGRGEELAILRSELACALSGHARVVFVEGDAGVGKSSLLTAFCGEAGGGCVLRAAGEESERLLAYGVVGQLLGGEMVDGSMDPLAVGMQLLSVIDRAQGSEGVCLVVVDDLHWADQQSLGALLFALRRLVADRVLALVSARPGELVAGAGWERFVAGDPRASRVRLGGLLAGDVQALAGLLGVGPLAMPLAVRLVEHTGGNPLYCRALLQELGPGALRADGALPAPKAFASVILSRLSGLPGHAQRLVSAAAVLGERCELRSAAELAGLDDPLDALEDALAAGLVRVAGVGAGSEVSLSHPLIRAAIYDDLGPARRRRLHLHAARLVGSRDALGHRVAAAVGSDDRLAGELEAAARQALRDREVVQAGAWFAQAAGISSAREDRDRLVLDAMQALLSCGEVAQAERLAAAAANVKPSARQSMVLGELDLLAGRALAAEDRLVRAWGAHDPTREAAVGAAAAVQLAMLCLIAGRTAEGVAWAERVAHSDGAPAALREHALCVLAVGLTAGGRGSDGLGTLAFLPSHPSEVPLEQTDALVMRGAVKLWVEDLEGGIADLGACVARLRAGTPLRYASQSLSYLAEAEYRAGRWDDALVHGELAVSLSHDTDRAWDYSYVHSYAAAVPAARGDLKLARAHVAAAQRAAQALGAADAIVCVATAQARLASASGDLEKVLEAAAAVRATGKAAFIGRPERHEWLPLEVEALLGLARLEQAAEALAELEHAISPASPVSVIVTAARLRGALAHAVGDSDTAAAAFGAAWRHAPKLRQPLPLALLEISDARRLRQTGRRDQAIAGLRSARARLAALRSRPYLERCDHELEVCGVQPADGAVDPLAELTQAELAVARLVASGSSNREVAAELFISVKTVEFHLRHVYAKLAIRSRVALARQVHDRG